MTKMSNEHSVSLHWTETAEDREEGGHAALHFDSLGRSIRGEITESVAENVWDVKRARSEVVSEEGALTLTLDSSEDHLG